MTVLVFPIAGTGVNWLAGVEAFQRESFYLLIRLLYGTENDFDVVIYGDPLSFRS